MQASDSYFTILEPSEGIFKDRGSKFIAKVFHVKDVDQCKERLLEVKKEYYDARHHCYAYRLGPEEDIFRSNDDGEPSGSAGKPILNQIYSFELFNLLVVVVRYFGGTKLGVSGLVNAYKTSARDAISEAVIVKKHITRPYALHFGYPVLNDVMRVLKEEQIDIVKRDFSEDCVIHIDVKKSNIKRTVLRFEKIRDLKIKPL